MDFLFLLVLKSVCDVFSLAPPTERGSRMWGQDSLGTQWKAGSKRPQCGRGPPELGIHRPGSHSALNIFLGNFVEP